jgi:hypothetical protein
MHISKRWSLASALSLLTFGCALSSSLVEAQTKASPNRAIGREEDTSSPAAVSKQFLSMLTTISTSPPRGNAIYAFPRSAPVSRKSKFELQSGKIDRILDDMATMLVVTPHFTTQILKSDPESAHVKVVRDDRPHEVVLLKEYGAWKVDVAATYALWYKPRAKEVKREQPKESARQ